MRNRDWNKRTVLIIDQGETINKIRRIIFGELGGYGAKPPLNAKGLVNYLNAWATVHCDPDGALFIDLAEPMIYGRRPLTANWN